MDNAAQDIEAALGRGYFLNHPADAARLLEEARPDVVLPIAEAMEPAILAPVWERAMALTAADLLNRMQPDSGARLLEAMRPNGALKVLAAMDSDRRDAWLERLTPAIADDLRHLMTYPPDSAGSLMNTRVSGFRQDLTIAQTVEKLRERPATTAHSLFLVDDDGVLVSRVSIQDLLLAEPTTRLSTISKPLMAAVNPLASRDEVAGTFDSFKLYDLPVIDLDGRLVGIVHNDALVDALQDETAVDIQTMVGASKDERALSPFSFAVRKRLPWLEINLLTAFMAAAVVGLFEDTIATYTALAVLLPVVAGQSGNSGSQALAVTIRGLALREITARQWLQVTKKELLTGLTNGIAIAITCGIGVYFWSGSVGLVLVIMSSMVLAMVAAGFAGALVPITLTRLGQDPAQSSSIILTTVTDIAGFFSFLGIATMLSGML